MFTGLLSRKAFLLPALYEKHLLNTYLEGHGDLVRGLVMGIIRVTIWVIEVINLLTNPQDPPSSMCIEDPKSQDFSLARRISLLPRL